MERFSSRMSMCTEPLGIWITSSYPVGQPGAAGGNAQPPIPEPGLPWAGWSESQPLIHGEMMEKAFWAPRWSECALGRTGCTGNVLWSWDQPWLWGNVGWGAGRSSELSVRDLGSSGGQGTAWLVGRRDLLPPGLVLPLGMLLWDNPCPSPGPGEVEEGD